MKVEQLFKLFFFVFFLGYGYLFYDSLSAVWFQPGRTSPDSLQQSFPLHVVNHPGIFEDDITYKAMRGYLPPLHYGISAVLTKISATPIMARHWVMALQIIVTLLLLFLGVKRIASSSAGLLACTWLLHARNPFGGLPRGWAPVVICAYLFCILGRNYWGVLLVLILGSLLHSPSTLVVTVAYALYLAYQLTFAGEAKVWLKHSLKFGITTAIVYLITAFSIARPPEIGSMVSYEQASQMPAFDRSGGRFTFVPLKPALTEFRQVGLRSFVHLDYTRSPLFGLVIGGCVALLLGATLIQSIGSKRHLLPIALWFYLCAVVSVYFLARGFAFKLYVPDRYLSWPLNLFYIFAFPTLIWQIGSKQGRCLRRGNIALFGFGALIFILSGTGLRPVGFSADEPVYVWAREHTPKTAYFAGYPDQLSKLPLFGIRRAFVTTETWHPFYDRYNTEMERRLDLTFRAYYSKEPKELLDLLSGEGISYFIFYKAHFIPNPKDPTRLKCPRYFKPFRGLIRSLCSGPASEYLYFKLDLYRRLNPKIIAYEDEQALVVDLGEFRSQLRRESN